jgi:hypothetical protein
MAVNVDDLLAELDSAVSKPVHGVDVASARHAPGGPALRTLTPKVAHPSPAASGGGGVLPARPARPGAPPLAPAGGDSSRSSGTGDSELDALLAMTSDASGGGGGGRSLRGAAGVAGGGPAAAASLARGPSPSPLAATAAAVGVGVGAGGVVGLARGGSTPSPAATPGGIALPLAGNKCGPVYLCPAASAAGGGELGQSRPGASRRGCSALLCTACDFSVQRFEDALWCVRGPPQLAGRGGWERGEGVRRDGWCGPLSVCMASMRVPARMCTHGHSRGVRL